MDPQIRITGDGSTTLYAPDLDETYHSMNGAIKESQHVFMEQGLEYYVGQASKSPVTILEIGLGTGLNAWLSWHFADNRQVTLQYTSLDPFPLEPHILKELNYSSIISLPGQPVSFDRIHEIAWEQAQPLSDYFTLYKVPQRIQDFQETGTFDVVYFDAFAPNKQPEIWEKEVLEKVKSLMEPGSCLVTYCAQGQFKRNLQSLGFEVSTLPGPPGKKEMTRAVLP
ncbi:MAG: tRNA (5-methylaminomethyl-2-thiouridine)(34)-methyltransferase MnmD [Cyclobacteriaceae bacterium]|nr:tRNA (5-methylaminomethyl-2-thiouridine)(34)-methyltransferase MnmD [Cyclobacteriaceae bacterium]